MKNLSSKIVEKWKLRFCGSVLFHMKARFCLTYFVHDLGSDLLQAPSNIIILIILITVRPLTVLT